MRFWKELSVTLIVLCFVGLFDWMAGAGLCKALRRYEIREVNRVSDMRYSGSVW